MKSKRYLIIVYIIEDKSLLLSNSSIKKSKAIDKKVIKKKLKLKKKIIR